MPWYEIQFIIGIVTTVFGFLYYVLIRKKLPKLNEVSYSNMKFAWWAGALLSFGATAFFLSVETTGGVAIPAVIASASPLVTSFCAYHWDKERLNIFKRVGAIIVVIGIMLLNII